MTHTNTNYVPPALQPLGTLSELTKAAGQINADNTLLSDTAFPNPS